jgi:hypothetical protein
MYQAFPFIPVASPTSPYWPSKYLTNCEIGICICIHRAETSALDHDRSCVGMCDMRVAWDVAFRRHETCAIPWTCHHSRRQARGSVVWVGFFVV